MSYPTRGASAYRKARLRRAKEKTVRPRILRLAESAASWMHSAQERVHAIETRWAAPEIVCYNRGLACFDAASCSDCARRLRLAFKAQPSNVGEWLSLVEHLVRDQGVGGSNPLSPTNFLQLLRQRGTSKTDSMVLHPVSPVDGVRTA